MGWLVRWNKGNKKESKDFGEHQEEAKKYADELIQLGDRYVQNVTVEYKQDKNKQHWYFR